MAAMSLDKYNVNLVILDDLPQNQAISVANRHKSYLIHAEQVDVVQRLLFVALCCKFEVYWSREAIVGPCKGRQGT